MKYLLIPENISQKYQDYISTLQPWTFKDMFMIQIDGMTEVQDFESTWGYERNGNIPAITVEIRFYIDSPAVEVKFLPNPNKAGKLIHISSDQMKIIVKPERDLNEDEKTKSQNTAEAVGKANMTMMGVFLGAAYGCFISLSIGILMRFLQVIDVMNKLLFLNVEYGQMAHHWI